MDTAFVAELLVAEGVVVAMIGEEKDDGIFEEIIVFETIYDVFDMSVGDADGVVMVSPFLAEDFLIRKVRRDLHVCRIDLVGELAGVGFSTAQLDLSEPGPFFWEGRPVDLPFLPIESLFLAGLGLGVLSISSVVLFAVVNKVVVILTFIKGGIAIFDEDLGEGLDALWKLNRGFWASGGAMLMSAGGRLINTGDHGGAAGRADRGRDIAAGKSDAIFAKLVESWGLARIHGKAVGFHPRRKVFAENPKDVRFICRRSSKRTESD